MLIQIWKYPLLLLFVWMLVTLITFYFITGLNQWAKAKDDDPDALMQGLASKGSIHIFQKIATHNLKATILDFVQNNWFFPSFWLQFLFWKSVMVKPENELLGIAYWKLKGFSESAIVAVNTCHLDDEYGGRLTGAKDYVSVAKNVHEHNKSSYFCATSELNSTFKKTMTKMVCHCLKQNPFCLCTHTIKMQHC